MEGFWTRFSLDPRQADNARMRASDADREVVRTALAEAFADGRLTRDEHDDRVGTLLEARTLGELPGLVDDLVVTDSAAVVPAAANVPAVASFRERGAAAYRKEVQEAATILLTLSIITWSIWGFTSAPDGHPWPLYPMLFAIVNLLSTAVRREAIVESEVKRLEKKAAKKAAKAAKAEVEEAPDAIEPGGPILGPSTRQTEAERPNDPS